MSAWDFKFFHADRFGLQGSEKWNTEANTTVIQPGEPVKIGSAQKYAVLLDDADGVIGTDFLIGIAFSESTQTASADGEVYVQKFVPGIKYIASAKNAAAVDTQAEYNALIGKRVLVDLTGGVFTIDTDTADSANNAFEIVDLEVAAYPGKVAFEVRSSGTSMN